MKQFKAFERKSCKDLRSHVIDIDQQTFQIDAAVERREGLELDGQFTGMADRKIEMDAVRSAEFKEAFDEFDKVRVTTAGVERRSQSQTSGPQWHHLTRGAAGSAQSHGTEPDRR